jgi:hypothetical protein
MALPVTVDRRVVAALLHLPEPAIAAAVARIAAGGTLVARERAGWQLSAAVPGDTSPGHSRERRDDLRARSARQIAISRGVRADYISVSRQIQDQLARWRRRP